MAKQNRPQQRIINAWCMYDWANSAFATTILAAVLPIYYSHVAGATLPSEATATAYWSLGLSLSLLIVAVLSPILGTVSDIVRGKKRFLGMFAGVGIIGTGLLVLVNTGDWLLASILFVLGRVGFTGSNVFYDALLPHVAKKEERDRVSARGYAMGYLGGGLLLAINVVMIQFLPGNWGPRISFLSVAIWWAVFTIPVLTRVPEPPSATAQLSPGETVIGASFKRIGETIKDIRRYRELFKYLIAFLIYSDGIGTIISVAAIYGAELGFASTELVLALLLVQFAGIPFSLIFGRLPSRSEKRRPLFLAFILFNLVMLPLVGIVATQMLPAEISGATSLPYESSGKYVGQDLYAVDDESVFCAGGWETQLVSGKDLGTEEDRPYVVTENEGAGCGIAFNGQKVEIMYSIGPDQGMWNVGIDGRPLIDEDTGDPTTIDAYNKTVRYGVRQTFQALEPGQHTLELVNSGDKHRDSQGTVMSLASIEVLPPIRRSNLGLILGIILSVQLAGIVFAWLLGRPLFGKLAEKLDTRISIILSLTIYSVIAIWAFFLDSVLEYWFLAWMVAVVQGGSQALSRSLYASLSPASKSGEFFGLYGVMEKFSAIIGPLLFAAAATFFDSSRPAILSLVVLFFLGTFLLTRVNIEEGQRVAQEEDAALFGDK